MKNPVQCLAPINYALQRALSSKDTTAAVFFCVWFNSKLIQKDTQHAAWK